MGLSCDLSTHFCTVPPVGLGEPCGPGIALCQLGKTALYPQGLTCWKRRDNKHGNCYLGCNPDDQDGDLAELVDTRCNSVPGLQCIRVAVSGCPGGTANGCAYSNHGGACVRYCNIARDDPQQCSTDDYQTGSQSANYTDGQVCIQTAIEACSWKDDYKPGH